jgi:hypothetical protein
MHWLFAGQADSFVGQVHWSPGLPQLSPCTVQSVVVQQAPSGMQTSPATHAFLLGGHMSTQWPPEQPWLAEQTVPHDPQLFGSLLRFEQVGIAGPPSPAPPLSS